MDFTIPGNPAAVRARAATMSAEAQTFTTTGDALATITTDGWSGRAADRFRERFETEPRRWHDAGDGFRTAATALQAYADALADAQRRADWARAEYQRGEEATASARAAYDADVARACREAAAARAQGEDVTLTILPFQDPGEAIRDGAVAEFHAAQADLEAAAHVCADGVRAGCQAAPEERNWLESAGAAIGGFLSGAGEAVWDLLTLPFSPISLLQDGWSVLSGDLTPEELAARYRLGIEQVGGMVDALRADPLGFGTELGKALLDWDTWADDPARALGHLVPDAIAAVFTAGAGAAVTRGVNGTVDALDALSDLARTTDNLDDVGDLARTGDRLGDLGRAEDLDPLHAYDDLAGIPVSERGTVDWGNRVVEAHPELSREGVHGIYDYTTDPGYQAMNPYLRTPGAPHDEVIEARLGAVSRGLSELPAYEGTTFRGTHLPHDVLERMRQNMTFDDVAFFSSSLDSDVALRFASGEKPGHDPVFFTVDGRTGVNVDPFSHYGNDEVEILFDRGTPFLIDRMEWSDQDGRWYVTMKERQ